MNANWKDEVRATHEGTESGTMTFAESVRRLLAAGLDGYSVDLRRAARTYYMPGGEALELDAAPIPASVAERFDPAALQAALREAQSLAPGYTYQGFCAKAARAGCAGYLVSFPGWRALYYGRTGETYSEHFPGARPE
jgi:uncharacterized protein YbcV (DUF1398 family)